MSARSEAKAAGLTRYFSSLCHKHPELEGERRTASGQCVECVRERVRAFQKKTRPDRLEYRRSHHLKTNFDLTLEQYDAMFAAQEGKCDCCGTADHKRAMAVDHCHATGKVRSLLCHVCNNHLGIFERKQEMFATYLEKHR